MEEVFVDIEGFEGLYQISNLGRVKSVGRLVKCYNGTRSVKGGIKNYQITKFGYLRVFLSKEGVDYMFLIHRLVAGAFIKNTNNHPQINHIDGNKLNNNVSNLEWCSPSENQKHAYALGLKRPSRAALGKFGKDNPSSKTVQQFDMNGNFITEYYGCNDASRKLGVGRLISQAARGVVPHAYGFIWKYKYDKDKKKCLL